MASSQQKRKSCAVARLLSILLPGLGSIYAGEYFAGVLWMLPGLVILGLDWSLLKLTIAGFKLVASTGALVANPGRTLGVFILLTIIYFIYSVYSSKDASSSAAQLNARQALLRGEY